ncbi:hypothetical protein [Candidatus Paracaedibacter symbiosus]|uniref:hypothetical protein n=1 Tax=Candidatus Paracaedibacter symbiosus TaxID=244582 RepID=UPI0005094FCF|nr:hypothetical protein [Candidatus Paracaedibacter symbiosus]
MKRILLMLAMGAAVVGCDNKPHEGKDQSAAEHKADEAKKEASPEVKAEHKAEHKAEEGKKAE